MIREITRNDKQTLFSLMDCFYHSDAVLHPVSRECMETVFQEAVSDSPYLKIYLLEEEGDTAGYGVVSLTFSSEAGGLCVWLEELYIAPEFRGRGLGSRYFQYIETLFADKAKRFRLEVVPENQAARRLYLRLGYQDLPYLQMVKENN